MDEMHLKGFYKEMVFLIDTCEALSLFDQVTAPNVYMIATSRHDESALASDSDPALNNYLSDNFSRDFFQFLTSPIGFSRRQDFTLAEFPHEFDFHSIKSHVSLVNTSETRELKDVQLREFIPVSDVTMGEGIDSK